MFTAYFCLQNSLSTTVLLAQVITDYNIINKKSSKLILQEDKSVNQTINWSLAL